MIFHLSKRFLTSALLSLVLILSAFPQGKHAKPHNIILMIGDGMGVAQAYSGFTLNHGQLNLFTMPVTGFSKTYSASNYITDSGAGGTALSTGHKTYNGAIGVDPDTVPVKSILEYAEAHGLATGLVSTSSITHATPASFIAHQAWRDNYEGIALDFLNTDIDVFIGGGIRNFTKRADKANLVAQLRQKGYLVSYSMDTIRNVKSGKLAGLTAQEHNPPVMNGRGDMLPASTQTAINILSKNRKGFFLMVEGSMIDWGGHANNTQYVATEVVDFDQAIANALAFAKKDGHTLVIVTADHETGGMSLTSGDPAKGLTEAKFNTTDHTAVMVPVYAYGPGAGLFEGVQENTDIFHKMMQLLKLEPQPEPTR
jgi:alkaline phosphatase